MRNECPKLRRKHDSNKKSLMATWEDSNLESDVADRHANICLMANTKKVLSKLDSYFNITSESSFSPFDENNYISFEDFLTNYNSISEKYLDLKQSLNP